MPALNIIAIHARFVNSGSESSAPSRIRPNRLIARTTHMTRKTSAAITNSQAKLASTQANAVLDAVSKESLPSAAQATTASTAITPMATTARSGSGSEPSGGASSSDSALMRPHYAGVYPYLGAWRAGCEPGHPWA